MNIGFPLSTAIFFVRRIGGQKRIFVSIGATISRKPLFTFYYVIQRIKKVSTFFIVFATGE
jgi:hypothetical protein